MTSFIRSMSETDTVLMVATGVTPCALLCLNGIEWRRGSRIGHLSQLLVGDYSYCSGSIFHQPLLSESIPAYFQLFLLLYGLHA